jgi:hypothetical protein
MTFGYEDIVGNIANFPENVEEIDDILRSLMEQFWHDPGLDFPTLEYGWSTCMGASG